MTESQNPNVTNRLAAQKLSLESLGTHNQFLGVKFGSSPDELSYRQLECDVDGVKVFIQRGKIAQLGKATIYRTEYKYFQDRLGEIICLTQGDETDVHRPLFNYLVATFGCSWDPEKNMSFLLGEPHTWSSTIVRMEYYANGKWFNHYNVRRVLPKAKGACLIVSCLSRK